jgi:phage tail-like protein
MRGTVPGLVSPHPLAARLPAVFQEEDRLILAFTESLDALLAPVISVLDNLPAYLSASHAPDDLLDWIAGWLGLVLDPAWAEPRRRELVARAADLLRTRGTPDGIRDLVALVTGCEVRVSDSGGVNWHRNNAGGLPGDPGCRVAVEVKPAPGQTVDEPAIRALLDALVPAHVLCRLTVAPAVDPVPAPRSTFDAALTSDAPRDDPTPTDPRLS